MSVDEEGGLAVRAHKLFLGIIVLISGVGASTAAPRDVQFRSVDTAAAIVELRNFGAAAQSLSGWRFCSHDENQVRRYSASSGLNGVSLAAGASLFVHFNNDAPLGDPSRFNISGIGGSFALPLDNGPYGLQIYFSPVNFGNGNTIADHLQWSINGVDDLSADERSDEAEAGGVWTDQNAWIATQSTTTMILQKPGAELTHLHGPDDFIVQGASTGGGQVPNGGSVPGAPLLIDRLNSSTIRLTWGDSCQAADTDFELYRGAIGAFDDFDFVLCSTGGLPTTDRSMPAGSVFFLVAPTDGGVEGSYGQDSDESERTTIGMTCLGQVLATCGP